MSELKPCPFCGGEAEILTAESMHGGYLFGIMCNDCRSRGDIYDTEAEAVAAWNTRSDDYKQAAEYWQRMYEQAFAERTCELIRHGSLANMPSFVCWSCSECGFGWHHSENDKQFSYCPNCGARVTPKNSETTPKVVS